MSRRNLNIVLYLATSLSALLTGFCFGSVYQENKDQKMEIEALRLKDIEGMNQAHWYDEAMELRREVERLQKEKR